MARVLLVRKLPLCRLMAHSLGTAQLVVPRADTASLGMASQIITKQAMVKQDMARPATRSLVETRSKADSSPRTRAMVTVASRAATIKVEVNLGPVGNHGISSSGNVDTECR